MEEDNVDEKEKARIEKEKEKARIEKEEKKKIDNKLYSLKVDLKLKTGLHKKGSKVKKKDFGVNFSELEQKGYIF